MFRQIVPNTTWIFSLTEYSKQKLSEYLNNVMYHINPLAAEFLLSSTGCGDIILHTFDWHRIVFILLPGTELFFGIRVLRWVILVI